MKKTIKTQLQDIINKMTFLQALCMSKGLNADYDVTSKAMQAFPKGLFGITPDDIKVSVEFKTAYFAYDVAFQNLRNFNAIYTKKFKKELAQMRDEKRAKQILSFA